jgi:hypothetical protein
MNLPSVVVFCVLTVCFPGLALLAEDASSVDARQPVAVSEHHSVRMEYRQRKGRASEILVRYQGVSAKDFTISLGRSKPTVEVTLEDGNWDMVLGGKATSGKIQVRGAEGKSTPIGYDIQLRFPIAAEKVLFEQSYAIIQSNSKLKTWGLERHIRITNETKMDIVPVAKKNNTVFECALIEDFDGGDGIVAEFEKSEKQFNAGEVELYREMVQATVSERMVIDPFSAKFSTAKNVLRILNGAGSDGVAQPLLAGRPLHIFDSNLRPIQPVAYSISRKVPVDSYSDSDSAWQVENKEGTLVLEFEAADVDVSMIKPAPREFEPWIGVECSKDRLKYLQARTGEIGAGACFEDPDTIGILVQSNNGTIPFPQSVECVDPQPFHFFLVDERPTSLDFPRNYDDFKSFLQVLEKLKQGRLKLCSWGPQLTSFLETLKLAPVSYNPTDNPFEPMEFALKPFMEPFNALKALDAQRADVLKKIEELETRRMDLLNDADTDHRQDLIRLDRAQEPYRRELRKLNSAIEEQSIEFDKSLRNRN